MSGICYGNGLCLALFSHGILVLRPGFVYVLFFQDAEESHTDLGVPRAASALAPPRRRGIGVLDGNGGGSRGKYEMVPQGLSADDGDSVDNHPPGDKESDGRGGGGVEKDSGVKGSSR